MAEWFRSILAIFALPEVGLSTIFAASFVGATLLPLASEPAVLAYTLVDPSANYWPAVLVGTLGNVLGGFTSFYLGTLGQNRFSPEQFAKLKPWLDRLGPRAMFFSFLPVVGDPLCLIGGWLKMPFWTCAVWMTVGKFLRYALMTALAVWGLGALGFKL
jgi:membrane protein YqaA with SNARE-associated domain